MTSRCVASSAAENAKCVRCRCWEEGVCLTCAFFCANLRVPAWGLLVSASGGLNPGHIRMVTSRSCWEEKSVKLRRDAVKASELECWLGTAVVGFFLKSATEPWVIRDKPTQPTKRGCLRVTNYVYKFNVPFVSAHPEFTASASWRTAHSVTLNQCTFGARWRTVAK